MQLTGKCKEGFETWYKKTYHPTIKNNKNIFKLMWLVFYSLSESNKYGVYVDYFDSVGLNITLTVEFDFGYIISEDKYQEIEEVKKWFDTRPLARTAAIEKANEIRNESIN